MKVRYHVSWGLASSHLFDIRMSIEGVNAREISLAMPAWVPGSYEILDSARHVQEFQARAGVKKLAWRRQDKQTWTVQTQGRSAVEIRYRVYANTVNCTASSLDETHAHITGGTVFLYLLGQVHAPCEIFLQKPLGWRIATGLEPMGMPGHYRAANYDELIDCPIEMGPFQDIVFRAGGKKHHLVIHDYGHEEKNTPRFTRDCAKFVEFFSKMFGGLPYKEYWFLCHFHPTIAKGGGLEHHNSTHISIPQYLDSDDEKDYDRFLEYASHEHFHLWNVKRLRPEGLGPFDYTKEVYTPSLWVAEGITEYFAIYSLRHAKIWDRGRFLEGLAWYVDRLNDMPGERLMSLREASITTWTNAPWHRMRAPDDVNLVNSYVDYYTKGCLLAWLLDLRVRSATKGKKSLEHVMRRLWNLYGKNDQPYSEGAVEEVVEQIAGRTVRRWLEREIANPKKIEYKSILKEAGLKLSFVPQSKKEESDRTRRKIDPSTGIEIDDRGDSILIANVLPGSVAEKSRLDRGDELLALDGERLTTKNWRQLFQKRFASGRNVEISLFRHHRLHRIPLKAARFERLIAKIEVASGGTAARRRVANSWLAGS